MTNSSISPRADETIRRFPSLASLRMFHSELLKHYREIGNTPELLSEVEKFICRGRETGALLDTDEDRWASQSLLDYWTAILYRAGREPPDATLVEFDPALAPELDDTLCPYLGLEAFREKNNRLFYGRQHFLEKLVDHLRESRLLAVVGSSGSGKSSLVLGGLMPSLKAGALPSSENWHYYDAMVPGSNPLANLTQLFRPQDVEVSTWVEQRKQQSEQFLQNPNHLTQLLNHADGLPSVLVIDQFEEVFTLCLDEAKRHAFINNLLGVIQLPDVSHRVILTIRTDFESHFTKIDTLNDVFKEAKVYVTPLNAGELRDTIEKPAELVGLKFEEGLVDKLIQDILGEPAALPLLQFTLLKLWESRERNRVTQKAYKKLGGGRLALSNSADELYKNLIPEDQVTCKRILLKMVRPTQGLEVTSSRISLKELSQIAEASDRVNRVLNKLIKARLVRKTKGDTPNDTQVEVAHEALIRNWPQLVEWLDYERVNLRQRLRLTAAAEQWEERSRDKSALWTGSLLEEARQYDDLNNLETDFVKQSIEMRRKTIEETEKQRDEALQWQVTALAALSETRFPDDQLGALIHILKAGRIFQQLIKSSSPWVQEDIRLRTEVVLRQIL
ncbi:MAG: hypothetical protein SAK29_29715, partial [Scytonema sp. PMC 1069.18]|nr:hypothetical protein [Scytonema sp. PMC 1069.18]